eukprot:1160989-Pelagomonas_calceolata.AAC.8
MEGSMREDAASPPESNTAAGSTQPGSTPCWVEDTGGGRSSITVFVLQVESVMAIVTITSEAASQEGSGRSSKTMFVLVQV